MATVRWIAAQQKRKQKNTLTIGGSPAAGNTVSVTMNSKTITYTVVTGDTTSTVASGLASLLQAATDGEFQLCSWSVSAAVITAEAAEAGVPFTASGAGTLTVAATGGGATITAASVLTNLSPNDVADVANYSTGALPSGGDTLLIERTTEPLRWNLSALSALTITLTVRDTFTPTSDCWIGNQTIHPTLGFREFRGTLLTATGFTAINIDVADGAPAAAFRFDGGAVASTIKLTGNGPSQVGQEVVEWIGSENTSNTIQLLGSSIALAVQGDQIAKIQTIKAINSTIRLEAGVTVNTSVTIDGLTITDGSTLDTRASIPTFTMNGQASVAVFRGSSAITTAMLLDAGTVFWNSSGNLATLKMGSGSTIDFSGNTAAITVGSGSAGSITMNEGTNYLDPQRRTIPFSAVNTLLLNRTFFGPGGANLDFRDNLYVQVTAGP